MIILSSTLRRYFTPAISKARRSIRISNAPFSTNNGAQHIPVMVNEVLNLWLPDQQQCTVPSDDDRPRVHLIDGTIGLGGHTLAALLAGSNIHVLGIDRDESALTTARNHMIQSASSEDSTSRVTFHHGSFFDITSNLLRSYNNNSSSASNKVDGILIDLGMNSTQIHNTARGFTFRKDGMLDMRFDNTSSSKVSRKSNTRQSSIPIAKDVVNNYSKSELSNMFTKYGDEPYAIEIAAAIVQWRKSVRPRPIQSTLELRFIIEDTVEKCIANAGVKVSKIDNKKDKENIDGQEEDIKKKTEIKYEQIKMIWISHGMYRYGRSKRFKLLNQYEQRRVRHTNHVMRCFQALRIEVNNELEHIQLFFERDVPTKILDVIGGRLVMIAFQPGEDRIVKEGMNDLVATGRFKWITPEEDGLRPTLEEVKMNGRSRTARLRAVERIQ